jgi:ADP-ribose pyrophosphatase YjhB (NUDIX family)
VPVKEVVVSGLVYSDGKLLLCRNRRAGNLWCTPGGKVESGEILMQAMHRELREEVGLVPQYIKLVGFSDLPERLVFHYMVVGFKGEPKNLEPDKHGDWEWVAHIPDDSVPGLLAFREGDFVRTGKGP